MSVDESGDEGVVCCPLPGRQVWPLIGADMARIESLRPAAQAVADFRGMPVRLVRFSVLEDLEEVNPR